MEKNFHQLANPQTDIEEIWNQPQQIIIDVRSSMEFCQGCVPGATNIPLLSDQERSNIGILYKKFGQKSAIERGYGIFEAKLDHFKKRFEQFPKHLSVVVYCARGGMRSQVITSFMRTLGYRAKQLKGGYKAFRKWNLNKLDNFSLTFPVILHGKTGVGKTLVLKQMQNSLDLEGLAQHRGSLFGAIGKQPVSQKTFEAHLIQRLEELENSEPVFIEGESRKIGDVIIPAKLFSQMQSARVILLEASIKTRVSRIIEEYILQHEAYHPKIREVISSLAMDLGKKNVERLLKQFDQGEYFDCFEFILINYYDRKYSHSLKNLIFENKVDTEEIGQAIREIQLSVS